jgi:DNA-binding HxlR family transcriptional regulator
MEQEPKDVIVLGTIKSGVKKFDKICKVSKIEAEELNSILEKLEERGLIKVEEKKGLFGKKIEINTTEKGDKELESRIHELQQDWNQMVAFYKSGDKKKLNRMMDDHRSFFPMMMFFGVIDMIMFSMMFSMIGASMTDYVPADQMPSDMDQGDGGDDMGDLDGGGGGFGDFDLGF